jgi:hypothetical protein
MAVMRLHFFHPDHTLFDVANKVCTSTTFQEKYTVFEKNPLLLQASSFKLQVGQQLPW